MIGVKCAAFTKIMAPIKAAITAGKPNLKTTSLLAWRPVSTNLKRLFRKWTIPVMAMATSIGK